MRSPKEQQVIESAYTVFFRYGYARTTMADLAKAAGLSRPALYLVFPGKAEIFQAVVEWLSEKLLAEIRGGVKDEWPLQRKLMYALELAVAQGYDAIKANPDAEDLLSLHGEIPALEAAYNALQRYFADLLREPLRQSSLKLNAADIARVLMASMRGFKLVATDGKDLRHLIEAQVTMLVTAIVRGETAPSTRSSPSARKRNAG
jgi:AcrR family transcriptional regulator